MAEDFVLSAEVREVSGKGASRRLRREQGLVPGIIYGGDKEPTQITLAHKDLIKQLENEAFYSHIVTLNIGSGSESVILKDLQRHPAKPIILHADFLRVSADQKLHTKVPLHFINEASSVGVKTQGGVVTHNITELDITCLPKDLPEFIEVDVAALEVGQSLHISEITLPEGVSSVDLAHDHDLAIATISKTRGASSSDEDGEAAATEE
ncbi:50S ribosomal protein L25/general stress protein Ctc [Sessilibacter corallicola]|uniref:50S ribosomal protein L25/general stress protein Ctc n=1 Tax=Sessilibacter corallicola TaxID=2904075 RepID=UPI001E3B1CDE|nr:50S ribosomal protein L25/general stress protein Ctc [Sessilibacter corallicola]MCE2027178.1 50S ribosomal protein L25/general stress protein Ctc [Sessilibacter corallicola]